MEKEQIITGSRLIIIGGSSGSLDPLLTILTLLPKNFSIPVVLVLHRNNMGGTALIELLHVKTALPVKEADEKERLQPGWIYIAPADYHVLFERDGTISLDVSEKVNYCRPSIDVSFSSAAAVYQKGLTAVLLSGANADGANAMLTTKNAGGINIVQDPSEATVPYMPGQAIQLSAAHFILSAAAIGKHLAGLSNIVT